MQELTHPLHHGLGSYPVRRRALAPQPIDFFSILLWCLLAVFAIQAALFASVWGFAWVALGVVTLVARQRLKIPLIGVMETPIFLAMVSYSVSTLYLAGETQVFDLAHDAALHRAMWLAWFGMACFVTGMILALRFRPGRRLKDSVPLWMTEKEAILLFLTGMFFSEILAPFVPQSLFATCFIFGYCAPIGIFGFLALQTRLRPGWMSSWRFGAWILALAVWSVRSVLGGIFGSTILILFIFLLQYAHRSKAVLLGLLAVAVFLAPLMQETKNDYRTRISFDARGRERALRDILFDNFNRVILHGDWNSYEKGIVQLAERLCAFDVWFSVKRHLDAQHDFAHGKTIVDALVTTFIPRIIWSSKPITGGSSELATTYADMIVSEDTSVGVGNISEFYINGGEWAVVFGMLALGALGGAILRMGWSERVQPLGIILSIIAFSQMMRPEANLSDVLGGLLRTLFLWAVLRIWLWRRHHHRIFRNPVLQKMRVFPDAKKS